MEKQFVREFIATGKPVLGICLGAQIIANAIGSKVFPNSEKEIGWFPIQGIPSEVESVFKFPHSEIVFHWHGETFDLPPGAVRLAKSKACVNQGFQLGRNVIGLQFHLETTPESARQIVINCRNELIRAEYIQSEDEILSENLGHYKLINGLMNQILSFLQRKDDLPNCISRPSHRTNSRP